MDIINVFPSTYLAPIEYYYYLLNNEVSYVDVYENYVKQTYRNRCYILSPNGIQSLTIPLVKARQRKLTKNVKIAYDDNWRKTHWKSLEAAYRSSPYFEFYEDDFYPFYHGEQYKYLIDFNWALEQKVIQLLAIQTDITKSEKYINKSDVIKDYRSVLAPNKKNSNLSFNPYIQVFSDRNDFTPNLSILDILFNEGPNTVNYLKEIKQLTNV